jgi:hypothetical protein
MTEALCSKIPYRAQMVFMTPVVKSGRHEVQPHAADC